jgi:glycerol-1-phosphate dehydrogenase [NAD(P)+]
MKFPRIAKKSLHGQKIAITSLTSTKLQKNLLERNEIVALIPSKGGWCDVVLENFFSKKIADECKKEFEQKILNAEEVDKINARMEKSWEKIRKELQEIHFEESRLKAIFLHFKIKISPKSLALSNQQYQDCVAHAKFVRSRFTCLDLQIEK